MTKQKPYLIDVEIRDGEHEHYSHAIYWAKTIKQAEKWAKAQCWDDNKWADPPNSYWSYGDGLTGTKYKSTKELTIEEAETLERVGVVFSANRPPDEFKPNRFGDEK